MKSSYIAAILAVVGVVIIVCAALLMTGGSEDDSDETFTVSFDTVGGSYVPSQSVQKNAKATEPVTSKDGYSFQGWFTSASGGSKFSFSEGITGNMTLYAHWSSLPSDTFVVTFDANGGTTVQGQTVKSGNYASEPSTSREGYTFAGWYTSAAGGYRFDFTTPIGGNITLYAHWTIDPETRYTVTFDANGGSPSTSWTVKAGDCAYEPATPSRTGYVFAGWYTSASGGSLFDFGTAVTGNMTLYAHWTKGSDASTCAVTLMFNDGTSRTTVQTVQPGDCATYPGTPTRNGYRFQGWYTSASGGSLFDFSTPITSDITLYAQWILAYYTVTFNANGGSTSSTQVVQYGQCVERPSDPIRSGTTFLGWYTSATGGTEFDFGTPITADKTLYAHWDVKYCKVVFNANGGSPSSTQNVPSGGHATAPTTPTKSGNVFSGWYTSASGGYRFDFGTSITSDITLYAHWTAGKCIVTLVDYPGYVDDMETYTVDYGESFSHTVTHFGSEIGKDLGVSLSMNGKYQYSSGNGFTLTEMGPFWTKIEYGPVTGNVTIYYRFA